MQEQKWTPAVAQSLTLTGASWRRTLTGMLGSPIQCFGAHAM